MYLVFLPPNLAFVGPESPPLRALESPKLHISASRWARNANKTQIHNFEEDANSFIANSIILGSTLTRFENSILLYQGYIDAIISFVEISCLRMTNPSLSTLLWVGMRDRGRESYSAWGYRTLKLKAWISRPSPCLWTLVPYHTNILKTTTFRSLNGDLWISNMGHPHPCLNVDIDLLIHT